MFDYGGDYIAYRDTVQVTCLFLDWRPPEQVIVEVSCLRNVLMKRDNVNEWLTCHPGKLSDKDNVTITVIYSSIEYNKNGTGNIHARIVVVFISKVTLPLRGKNVAIMEHSCMLLSQYGNHGQIS